MATPAVAGFAVIQGVASIFDRLISAHTECKRIEVEMEAVRARYRVESKKCDIVEKTLALQHAQIMETMKQEGELARQKINESRKQTAAFIRSQDKLLEDTGRLLTAAMEKDISDIHRKTLLDEYTTIHSLIAQKFYDSMNQTNQFLLSHTERVNQAHITFQPKALLNDEEK